MYEDGQIEQIEADVRERLDLDPTKEITARVVEMMMTSIVLGEEITNVKKIAEWQWTEWLEDIEADLFRSDEDDEDEY